jgi:hypothetical protein
MDRIKWAGHWFTQRLTDRQQMIQAWGWVCFALALRYCPLWVDDADLPAAVLLVVPHTILWVVSVIWAIIGVLGGITMYLPQLERFWWPTLIGAMTSWAGTFLSAWIFGHDPTGWTVGIFYLFLVRGIWTTKGHGPDLGIGVHLISEERLHDNLHAPVDGGDA